MARLTTDPNDPELTRGGNTEPSPQANVYLVLSDEELAKGFVRPVRQTYVHVGNDTAQGCGQVTSMGLKLSETYARDPSFYGYTYCVHCMKHLPVDEFVWRGTTDRVGS